MNSFKPFNSVGETSQAWGLASQSASGRSKQWVGPCERAIMPTLAACSRSICQGFVSPPSSWFKQAVELADVLSCHDECVAHSAPILCRAEQAADGGKGRWTTTSTNAWRNC